MKKTIVSLSVVAASALLASCGGLGAAGLGTPANGTLGGATSGTTNSNNSSSSSNSSQTGGILGGIFGSNGAGSTLGNVLGSVLGLDKLTTKQLVGTWHYKGPGCAFISENALAKAGGEVAAAEVKEKLAAQYAKLGFTAANTSISFNEDGTFNAHIDGKALNGKWTYNEEDGKLEMKTLLLSLSGYAKKNSDGIGVLFESKKILTLLQTLASVSGNTTLSTIGDLSKNYDGVRVGFDMTK